MADEEWNLDQSIGKVVEGLKAAVEAAKGESLPTEHMTKAIEKLSQYPDGTDIGQVLTGMGETRTENADIAAEGGENLNIGSVMQELQEAIAAAGRLGLPTQQMSSAVNVLSKYTNTVVSRSAVQEINVAMSGARAEEADVKSKEAQEFQQAAGTMILGAAALATAPLAVAGLAALADDKKADAPEGVAKETGLLASLMSNILAASAAVKVSVGSHSEEVAAIGANIKNALSHPVTLARNAQGLSASDGDLGNHSKDLASLSLPSRGLSQGKGQGLSA